MDSISQAMLGSAVALVATKGKHPQRAIIVGAALGTLPDLDVLIPFENDLDAMTRHRSWSHSWLVHLLVAPAFAWVLGMIDRNWGWMNRFFTCLLVLMTHSGLDALTIYGTWLFWPFGIQPIMGGSVFIIDPLYTLPLLLGVLWVWRHPNDKRKMIAIASAVSISSIYLCWGLLSKQYIESLAFQSLSNRDVSPQNLVATPTPFNSVLWRIIAVDQEHFYEGFYSHIAPEREISFRAFDRGIGLVQSIENHSSLDQFRAFNHGFHAFSNEGDRVLGQDLRMGAEPFYFFQFEFARYTNPKSNDHDVLGIPVAIEPMAYAMEIQILKLFGWIGKRFFDEDLVPIDSPRHVAQDSFSAH